MSFGSSPLFQLAQAAASLEPSHHPGNSHTDHTRIDPIHRTLWNQTLLQTKANVSDGPAVVTPCLQHSNSEMQHNHQYSCHHYPKEQQYNPHQSSMLSIRLILERPQVASSWGMTVSMLDPNYLIVGYIDRSVLQQYTMLASYDMDSYHKPHQIPSQNNNPNQHCHSNRLLQPGDIIRTINNRPIHSFPSFVTITEFFKTSMFLSLQVLRATTLPLLITSNTLPHRSYWVAAQTHQLLKGELQPYFITKAKIQLKPQTHNPQPARTDATPTLLLPVMFTNPLFHDGSGKPLPFEDDFEFHPDDGFRAKYFLTPIECFRTWLDSRKDLWRKNCWNTLKFHQGMDDHQCIWHDSDCENDAPSTVPNDFWSHQGFSTFETWHFSRSNEWKRQYSWNRQKRRRIEEDADEIVHFPNGYKDQHLFRDWLRVRKNQWKIIRRKHQRKLDQIKLDSASHAKREKSEKMDCHLQEYSETVAIPSNPLVRRIATGDMLLIDELLEERERKRQANLQTFDLNFVFDAKLGAPDDVIAHCLRYLHPCEHWKLLCINSLTSNAIKERDDMWRQLCPAHWILPRRPRKRWYDLYLSKIRNDMDASRKRSDDLLSNVANILLKGDHLHKVEKLVADGEHKFSFDVNFVSGVVCERNSILNLAVIHGRHKVVRWLVEIKKADLETSDRGGFTPLINAAWAGDFKLVRFLMSKGCDRTKLGRGHYTKPLAAPDFKGYTAEGWAREKSFPDVADLLRVGL